jgi:hypothetical protein
MTDDILDQDQLRELAAQTAQLPREIDPPADAWASIKASIESPQKAVAMAFWQRPAFLAAAALLLVAGSSIVTAVALGNRDRGAAPAVAREAEKNQPTTVATIPVESVTVDRPVTVASVPDPAPAEREPAPSRVTEVTGPGPGIPATLAEFTKQENEYISTANRLSAILESGQMALSPRTIAKLKESLRVIDAAILEARAALAEDPGNRQVIEMLSTSYNKKLDLLKRTTEMGRS